MRVRSEPVGVVVDDGSPVQVRWRGRRRRVVAVHDRWSRAGRWWDGAEAAALLAGAPAVPREAELVTVPIPSSPRWAQRAWGEPAPDVGAVVEVEALDDAEQRWWRVELAADRSAGSAVGPGALVDLCLVVADGSWHLARVVD